MTKFLFITILFSFFLGKPIANYAQVEQLYRYEQNVTSFSNDVTVISLKKNGVTLVQDLEVIEKNHKKWRISILDTTLNLIWASDFGLPIRNQLVGYEYNLDLLYLLFRNGNNDFSDFNLVSLNLASKVIHIHELEFELELGLTHFTMAGQSAIFGGYVNLEPVVLVYDPRSNQTKIISGFFVKGIKILDVRANQNQSFNVLLINRSRKHQKKLIVRSFSPMGQLILEDEISVPADLSIISGITSKLDREELLITGTYGYSRRGPSAGIFSVNVNPFLNQKINFTNYSSLDNFLSYLPARQATRAKSNDLKRKKKGLPPSFRSHVNPSKLVEKSDGFYLLTEVYSPRNYYNLPNNSFFRNQQNFFYPFNPPNSRYYNPRGYANTTKNNHDVKMIQAAIIKIDSEGVTKYDFALPLQGLYKQNISQFSDFTVNHNGPIVVYKISDKIFFNNYIPYSDDYFSLSDTTLNTLSKEEKVRKNFNDDGNILHWFDDSFYAWGFQTVDRLIDRVKDTRRVFYINRVQFR